MNQKDLYATLHQAGCRILSFEDYPENYGSWRVSFLFMNALCDVTCNRADSLLLMTSTKKGKGKETVIIPSKRLVSDRLELAKVDQWLRTAHFNLNLSKPDNVFPLENDKSKVT